MARRAVARDQRTRTCNASQQKPNDQSVCIRFFKVVFGKDCSKVLYIPPLFAPKVKHLVSKCIQIKDSCGGQWSVTLDECDDGSLAFQRGWHKFFLDHELKEGDFLVFGYMGDHFLVLIFEETACERTDFNNVMPPQNKRSRRDFETDSPSKLFQNTNMNLKDSPNSDSSVASGTKLWNSPTELVEEKAEFEGLQRPPRSIGMEDTNCILNRDDGHQGEGVSILYDLSKFEMGNMASHSKKFDEGINSKVGCSSNRSADQSKTNGGDTEIPEIHTNLVGGNSGDVFTGNLNKDLNARLVPSGTNISKRCKTVGNDNQIVVELANEISGSSGENLISETEKDLISKRSCTGITGNNNMIEVDGTETTVLNIDSPKSNVDSGRCLGDYFCTKPTDYTNSGKGMEDSKIQQGCGKIIGKESVEQNRAFNSSFSSTMPKNLIETGKRSIKEELTEKLEVAGSTLLSCVKERNTAGTRDQVFPTVVKTEPDLPLDAGSSSFSPFTVEVQNLRYQEVPITLPSFPRRREKGRGRVIYLKDSLGRTWPVLQPDTYPVLALTSNWRKFCTYNNIKLGNKCTFQADEDIMNCCRVEIDRNM